MNAVESVSALFLALERDGWRQSHPFSDNMNTAHEVILDPFATDHERAEALRLWLHKNQPCLFGRIAAKANAIHVCVLTDDDLRRPDDEIRGKIERARRLWKIGSLRNERAEHGFVLLVASPRVARALPDQNLLRFAHRIRALAWGDQEPDEFGNDVTWETLYLRHPSENRYVRFTFSVDYFGSQGDGRWWHDHRVPGGIAFTANSVGHMALTRDWYDGLGPQVEWIVKVAMETVHFGASTQWGKSIWLEDLQDGQPARGGGCPFADPGSVKEALRGKDWSYYAGYLSTDHSVRVEFFREGPERPAEIRDRWLLDLQYLYDPAARDHAKFVAGEPVNEEDVYRELGTPDSWRVGPTIIPRPIRRPRRNEPRPIAGVLDMVWRQRRALAERRIRAALETMRREWIVPD